MFGAREAAWPLIRADLGLSYIQIGLLITVPSVVGAVVDPWIAVLGDTGHRRRIVATGGIAFILTTARSGVVYFRERQIKKTYEQAKANYRGMSAADPAPTA